MTGLFPDLEERPSWHDLKARIEAIRRPHRGFRLILADNPWRIAMRSAKGEKKSPQRHYECVPTDVLASIEVWRLAATDSVCLMWATWPMLEEQIACLKAWGFVYKSGAPWFKGSKNSEGDDCEDEEWKAAFGTGYLWRSCSELILIGTRGKPVLSPRRRSVRGAFFDPLREHSRKPDDQYEKAEALIDGPYLELFSRTDRKDWTSFGNEAGRFGSA